MPANPHCPDCNGRGGHMIHGRWAKCPCTFVPKAATRALRSANMRADRPYRSVSETIAQPGQQERG